MLYIDDDRHPYQERACSVHESLELHRDGHFSAGCYHYSALTGTANAGESHISLAVTLGNNTSFCLNDR